MVPSVASASRRCWLETCGGVWNPCRCRLGVAAQRDLVELILAVHRQVRALGQVLTEQAVGVFVAAALPGAVRVGEVDRRTGSQGQRVEFGMQGTPAGSLTAGDHRPPVRS